MENEAAYEWPARRTSVSCGTEAYAYGTLIRARDAVGAIEHILDDDHSDVMVGKLEEWKAQLSEGRWNNGRWDERKK